MTERNSPFCFSASFSFFSLTPLISKPYFSGDLTILMMPSISLFEIHNRALSDSKIFFLFLTVSVAHAPEVDPMGTRVLLANFVIKFFINDKPVVIIGPRKLKNPPSRLIIFLAVPLTLFRIGFFGAAHGWGGAKKVSPP